MLNLTKNCNNSNRKKKHFFFYIINYCTSNLNPSKTSISNTSIINKSITHITNKDNSKFKKKKIHFHRIFKRLEP